MSHFNFKSLAFYGIAIASVLVLFRTVTVYGENNLKAPAVVSDRYRLTLDENLPNCEKPDTLALNIEQSGIYLNASLSPANSNADFNEKHSLIGILKNQQLNLSGNINRSILCNIPQSQENSLNSVTIQMQLAERGSVPGQLTVNGIPQTLKFTAVPEKVSEKSQNSH
ncbi:MAG: hypothetical protein RMX96_09650 [Nostoc sp. ChiSLP02]|nr:hypothetical protein [Nostoc sp. DedSLP05]MDZ8101227.1 hypothetical protein [Nostoc sp. DedSLP01]MDZ8185103.1 hypothetical protein [Nostoc sp. ChiSLP02]